MFTSGKGDLLLTIKEVFGRDFSDNLVAVNSEINGIKVSGYVSHPYSAKATRSMQNFFVNNRFVKNKTLYAAVEEAFKGSVMVGKYPYCVLFIDLPAIAVDVNVHPAKTEIRFSEEKRIFECVYHAVKNAVDSDYSRPQVNFGKINPVSVKNGYEDSKKEQISIYNELVKDVTSDSVSQIVISSAGTEYNTDENDEPVWVSLENIEKTEPVIINESDNYDLPVETSEMIDNDDYRVVGEVFNTYIIVEQNNKILLIDKHASHERILYEQLKKNSEDGATQLLFTPVNVSLSMEEYSALIENFETVNSVGFVIEDFGKGSVLVRECPMDLSVQDINDFILEITDYLTKNKKQLVTEKQDWILHNIACRAAVKGGNITSDFEREKFVKMLQDNGLLE